MLTSNPLHVNGQACFNLQVPRTLGRAFRWKQLTLTALILCVVFSSVGCGPAFNLGIIHPHTKISDKQRNILRYATPLEPESLANEPSPSLADTPVVPGREILKEAKSVLQPLPDDEIVRLALPEINRDALEYNLNLQVDLHNPLIAEQGYISERWKFESVLATGQSQNIAINGFGGEADNAIFDTSLRVPTRLGGMAFIGIPFSRASYDPLAFNPQTNALGGRTDITGFSLGVNQPLLRNAGIDVNFASINIAGLILMQTDARTRLSAIRILANAEQAYWSYFFAYENLAIQVRLYELSLKQLESSKRLVEEAVRTKAEIVRAQSGVAQRYEQVVSAELNRRLAERTLKRLMNSPLLPTNGGATIIPETPPDPKGIVFDRRQVVELALANRVELIDNEFQQSIDRINIQVNQNAVLPDIRFDFRYAFAGDGATYNDALDRLFRPELDNYSFGLQSTIPIQGNQSARARLQQSRLLLSQTQAFREAVTIAITEETLKAVDSVEKIWQRIIANRIFVESARESYNIELIQFEKGESTNTEVFVQLSNLAQAEQQYVLSLADYQRSLVDLAFASGTILGKSGVVFGNPSDVPAFMETLPLGKTGDTPEADTLDARSRPEVSTPPSGAGSSDSPLPTPKNTPLPPIVAPPAVPNPAGQR
jgi:outer membrane protein TolC